MKKLICIKGICLALSLVGFSQTQKRTDPAVKAPVMKTENQQKKNIPTKHMYTCPMHPEVLMDKPGKCPKCGMNLIKKVSEKVIYTCPMHKEVQMDKPGKCPKCGMNLVKKMPIKKAESNKI